MIISCEKCTKKFELSEKLIPSEGRLLQCGSCFHKWHYIPKSPINLVDEATDKKNTTEKKPNIKKEIKKEEYDKDKSSKININNKKVGFLSYLLVAIISFVALIILVDTFKSPISTLIPDIDFYLSSLYESLKDILLFFKDLTG